MYSLASYGAMISDEVRIEAYAEALRRAVRSDSVVVDIGTGTGIFALIACQNGARRVYALDSSEFVHLAAHTAAENGFADRMICLQAISTAVDLPEKADVVVSDICGQLPWVPGRMEAIDDARRRLLAPGGVLIPNADRVWLALAQADKDYRRISSPWVERPFGLAMEAATSAARNRVTSLSGKRVDLLSEPVLVAAHNYSELQKSDLDVDLLIEVTRVGTAHGFVLWFDIDLVEGVGFSSAPGGNAEVYGQVFLPLAQPVKVQPGCRVMVRLRAVVRNNKYEWLWRTSFSGPGSSTIETQFTQSSVLHPTPSMAVGGLADRDYVPRPSPNSETDRVVLEKMDGKTSMGELAHAVQEAFPDRYAEFDDALDLVRDVSGRYL